MTNIARFLKTKRFPNSKGVTLLEMLFSFAILGLAVIATAGLLIHSKHLSEDSRFRLVALNAARSTLEAVKETPLQGIPAININALIPADLPNGTITLTANPVVTAATQISTITITVGWNGSKNRARQLEITTMRSRF